jgi:hypothetical protein
VGFPILEVTIETRAVLPCVNPLAIGFSLYEVADIRVRAFCFAGPFGEFGTFVALTVKRADEIAVLQPTIVRECR